MVAGGNLPERIALFYPVYGIPFQIRNSRSASQVALPNIPSMVTG